jgi:hypothetical protein
MTPDLIELGKRAVACKGWRWMPGMLVLGDPESAPRPFGYPAPTADLMLRARIQSCVLGRFFAYYEYHVDLPDAEGEPCDISDFFDPLPDLSDPATLGCLLALVREAWSDECAHCSPLRGEGRVIWYAWSEDLEYLSHPCATEADALVAALEAAP